MALGRSIQRTVETLQGFQTMNKRWPTHYPAVSQRPSDDTIAESLDDINHNSSSANSRPIMPIRRAQSTIDGGGHSKKKKATGDNPEPRLAGPTMSQELNVLKLDLRVGALSNQGLVHSLEKSSIAALLDSKIQQAIKHLLSLRDRIEDTSSKVLVTGDLNAGKSTFCNALLRKKVLPEDQQPCTEIFCEVLDARVNNGVEEVHAIPKDVKYNRLDERTYDCFPLKELEDIVIQVDKYAQAKVYVEDVRAVDESLLRNGVVDISLIDAPGLNLDSVQTTAVFSRQEEIDVVVFVVSAENHFTLSAKEFIWNAAHEKAYLFIVVNRFDNIRDKVRCQRMILEQIANLSPQTFRDSQDLVHFVSSNAVIDGKDPDKIDDFNNLENSLRGFVLDKRARSKLAPAKTYLMNLLGDLENLSLINQNMAARELDSLRSDLSQLTPRFDQSMKARLEVLEECDRQIEETCSRVYKDTRRELERAIAKADEVKGVVYNGFFSSYAYAEQLRRKMLDTVTKTVLDCENAARRTTVGGVNSVNALGLLHLKKDFIERTFRPEFMFKKRKDVAVRGISTEIEVFDFFDFDRQEKFAGASLSLTLVSVAGGKLFGIGSWVDGVMKVTNILGVRNARRLLIPALILAGAAGAAFIISDIQRAVPRKLAKKIRRDLIEMDYIHINSERISKEVRKVMKIPSEEVRSSFQKSLEGLRVKKEETTKRVGECEVAVKYFGNLLKEAREHSAVVRRYDLEGAELH